MVNLKELICPKCNSLGSLTKKGTANGKQQYSCKVCKHITPYPKTELTEQEAPTPIKESAAMAQLVAKQGVVNKYWKDNGYDEAPTAEFVIANVIQNYYDLPTMTGEADLRITDIVENCLDIAYKLKANKECSQEIADALDAVNKWLGEIGKQIAKGVEDNESDQ